MFTPTSLPKALNRLGFVQADPLRAPARAQDLTLRHRVTGYCVGDLELRYPKLPIEEDFFVKTDLNQLKKNELLEDEGNLQQEDEPENKKSGK